MSEAVSSVPLQPNDVGLASPGQRIREAREAMGLHIVALAAALKVPVRKLEALEANRWEELTDATFTRALASSVARHLKMDVPSVLAGLPAAAKVPLTSPAGLARVSDAGAPVNLALNPAASSFRQYGWVALLLIGAATLYFSPQLMSFWPSQPEPVVSADAPADVPQTGVSVQVDTVPAVPIGAAPSTVTAALGAEPASTGPVSAAVVTPPTTVSADSNADVAENLLVIGAANDTWVEVTDSSQRIRTQRVLKAGEEISFADGYPFAVVVGNAAGATVAVRGKVMDLAPWVKNNVARFEVR